MPNPLFLPPVLNPFGLNDLGKWNNPNLVDIDRDGDLDVLAGNSQGNIFYYQNIGTASAPSFAAPVTNPFGLTDVGERNSPTFVDIDRDGDLDAFIGNSAGNISFFLNVGTATSPSFGPRITNPFGLTDVGDSSSPAFVDIDRDGDLDAFIGTATGNTVFFRNDGTALVPSFAAPNTNPFGLTDVGDLSSPTFVDLDSDGDFDAFIGNSSGSVLYFRNDGSATVPNFAPSVPNPFGLTDVGNNSSPSFGDLDANGSLDALFGNKTGNFNYFQNIVLPDFNFVFGTDAGEIFAATPKFDIIDARGGNDTIIADFVNLQSSEIYDGGDGVDNFELTGGAAAQFLTIDLGATHQWVSLTPLTLVNMTLLNFEDITLTNFAGKALLTGNSVANTLRGGVGNDTLNGAAGDDVLRGNGGNDTFDGGIGTDTLREFGDVNFTVTEGTLNGLGTDTFTGIEIVRLTAGGSNNTLDASALTTTLANLSGQGGNDSLTGGQMNDSLFGDEGADTLTGGLGNDRLVLGVDTVMDTVRYASGDGMDNVVNFVLGSGGDILEFSGISNIDVRVAGSSTQFRVAAPSFGTGSLLLTVRNVTGFSAMDADVNFTGANFKFS
jgi:Ca2+-binding RTX toxin-like protein